MLLVECVVNELFSLSSQFVTIPCSIVILQRQDTALDVRLVANVTVFLLHADIMLDSI